MERVFLDMIRFNPEDNRYYCMHRLAGRRYIRTLTLNNINALSQNLRELNSGRSSISVARRLCNRALHFYNRTAQQQLSNFERSNPDKSQTCPENACIAPRGSPFKGTLISIPTHETSQEPPSNSNRR